MASVYKIDLSKSKKGFGGGLKTAKSAGGCEFKGSAASGTILMEGQKIGTYEMKGEVLNLTVVGAKEVKAPDEKDFKEWFK